MYTGVILMPLLKSTGPRPSLFYRIKLGFVVSSYNSASYLYFLNLLVLNVPTTISGTQLLELCRRLNGTNQLSKYYNTSPQPAKYIVLVKQRGKGMDTCYSATHMSQTRDQQRFTISDVAADWHEPVVPQRIMWPSIARANGQLDARCR